jgi:hypothetical protein
MPVNFSKVFVRAFKINNSSVVFAILMLEKSERVIKEKLFLPTLRHFNCAL